MVNSNFKPQDKKSGDLILSADWNAAMSEIKRLETAKSNRGSADIIQGPLTIQEALNVNNDVKISGTRLKSADNLGILETNKKDWLRINPDEHYPAIALYKSVAIGSGGLAIGEWTAQPAGVLKVTQSAYLASTDGNVGIGTIQPRAKLQIINQSQDASGNTLVLGDTSASNSNLRLGYHQNYSWIQSHGSKPVAINPLGNNVGIGTTDPKFTLDVAGIIQARGYKTTVYTAGGRGRGEITLSKTNAWADFPELLVTFSLSTTATVFAFYQIAMEGGNSHLVTRMYVNTTIVSTSICGNATYWGLSDFWIGELNQGSHTIKIQYRTPQGGTNISSGDWHNRVLRVMVFGS
jgi:hypothetical protein